MGVKTVKDTITEFRRAHDAILATISAIQMVVRSYSQASPKLSELSDQLLAHWGRQNDELTERLSRFYAEDREATKMLEFLVYELKDVKVKYLVFYDKHAPEFGHVEASQFSKDFTEFAGAVIGRINMEEEYLIPLLEKLPD